MTTPNRLGPIISIAKYTLIDEIRQRSFVVMFAVLALFILLSRGCYQGNYMVNGQPIDSGTIAGTVSKVTFHVVALGVGLIAALLSMRVLKRDRDDGMQSSILSKPIARWQYITGKISGLWVLSALLMVVLHVIILIIVSITMKAVVPGYLFASLLCSFNLLFVVVTVLLFSLLMPDIVAILCVMGIGIVGFISDGIFALSQSQIAQAIIQQPGVLQDRGVTLWTVFYRFWPKVSGTQRFAASFIDGSFSGIESVYPLFNVLAYCLIIGFLLFRRFRREEII